jgi:hypothetical protein
MQVGVGSSGRFRSLRLAAQGRNLTFPGHFPANNNLFRRETEAKIQMRIRIKSLFSGIPCAPICWHVCHPIWLFSQGFSMRRALVSICVLQAFSASSWAEEATIDTASL